jgi:quercetin 2,3-dioxygenase
LLIRSATWIQDLRLMENSQIKLPEASSEDTVTLFYVFNGAILVNDETTLQTGESLLIENEIPNFKAIQTSDVVLFITDKTATYYKKGMYSGNQK